MTLWAKECCQYAHTFRHPHRRTGYLPVRIGQWCTNREIVAFPRWRMGLSVVKSTRRHSIPAVDDRPLNRLGG
jgi:hypothetical protein